MEPSKKKQNKEKSQFSHEFRSFLDNSERNSSSNFTKDQSNSWFVFFFQSVFGDCTCTAGSFSLFLLFLFLFSFDRFIRSERTFDPGK